MPPANSDETNAIRQNRKRVSSGSSPRRGRRSMMPGSAGSKANVMASSTELTMFTHRICTGVIGKVTPSISAASTVSDSPPLTGSRNSTAFFRLS